MANVRWEVYRYSSGYPTSPSYIIPTPGNGELSIKKQSNIAVVKLADGSQAIVSPQIKSIPQALSWQISEATTAGDVATTKTLLYIEKQIQTDIDDKKKIRIKTHAQIITDVLETAVTSASTEVHPIGDVDNFKTASVSAPRYAYIGTDRFTYTALDSGNNKFTGVSDIAVNHTAGEAMYQYEEFEGYFLSCTKVYLQSGKEQLYRLEIEFQVV